jgi:hypothetical protein
MEGSEGRSTFLNDHQTGALEDMAFTGKFAPSSIHDFSTSISAGGSFASGGIGGWIVWVTAWKSLLWAGLPGTIAGPFVPPFKSWSRESSRKPDMATVSPWHE